MRLRVCLALLTLPAVPAAGQMVPVPAKPVRPGASMGPADQWTRSRSACVDARQLAGAIVIDPRTLELSLGGGQRARLLFAQDCAHLGYYGGFYYRADTDGRLCAGRDSVMGREGGACPIREIATPRPPRRRGG